MRPASTSSSAEVGTRSQKGPSHVDTGPDDVVVEQLHLRRQPTTSSSERWTSWPLYSPLMSYTMTTGPLALLTPVIAPSLSTTSRYPSCWSSLLTHPITDTLSRVPDRHNCLTGLPDIISLIGVHSTGVALGAGTPVPGC